jgi:hypothetical protein
MKGENKPKKGTKGVNDLGNLTIDGVPDGAPFCMRKAAYVDDYNWSKIIVPWLTVVLRALLSSHQSHIWQLLVLDGCISHTMTFEALELFQKAKILVLRGG